MASFICESTSRIDDRGRLVFPAPLKGMMPPGSDMRFVIKKSLYDDCLEMWTHEEWEKEAEKIREGLDFFNPQHVQFWREYMRDCDIVEPDARLGRISISRYLLDAIGVTREVEFFGIGFKIEIWAKEQFEQSRISNENYVAIAKSLSRK